MKSNYKKKIESIQFGLLELSIDFFQAALLIG